MLRLLGISASVVDIGVRKAGGPHHDASERRIVLVLGHERSQSAGLKIVLRATFRSRRTQRRCRDPDKDFRVGRGGVGHVGHPLIVVNGTIDGAAGVVVELHPEVVKLRVVDNDLHVGLRNGTLRRTGDVVRVGRVRSKVGAQLADQILVVLVPGVALNVKVPAVDKGTSKGSRHASTALGIAVRLPKVLSDGLGLGLGGERIRADGAAEGQNDLDAVGLAGLDGRGQSVAVLRLPSGRNVAGLADGTGGDGVSISVLIQEGQHNDIDAGGRRAVGGQVVVLDCAAAVLAPVHNVLGTGRAGGDPMRHGRYGSSHQAEGTERFGEVHGDQVDGVRARDSRSDRK